MRRLFLSISVFLLLLSSCGRAVGEQRVLLAGGDHNFPPYDFVDANGQPSGFNVDMLRAVAKQVSLDVEIRMGPWSQVRDDLENGRIDIVTGMIASAERENRVDFTAPFLTINYAVFARKGTSVKTVDELRGLELIVQRNDIMHDYAVTNNLTSKLILVESQVDALHLLASGRHDAALTSKLQGLYLIHKYMLSNVEIAGQIFHPQDLCFAVTEDNDELQARLNEGLRIIKATRIYEEIYQRWFGTYDERTFAEELLFYTRWIFAPLLTLLLAAMAWSWSLKKQVRRKTQELQHELSERQRVETQLASERQFREFIEAAPMPMGAIDQNEKLRYLNHKFTDLFGYTYDELPDIESWLCLAYPDENYRQKVREEFHTHVMPRVRKREESIAMTREITCKDGSKRSVIIHFAPVGKRGFLVFNDITDLKNTETALRQSEARIKGIFHNLAAGIEVLNREGVLVEVNDQLAAMLGYTPQELIGKSPLEFTHPDDLEKSREILEKALQGQVETYRCEKRYVRKNGSFFWGDLCFSQVVSPTGEVIEDIGIIFDVTERKAIEHQLREVNRELEAFVYSVSHDLRTPLTPILGYAEHLAHTYQDQLDDTALDCLREIEKAGKRMQALIEDLLQLASVGHLARPERAVQVEDIVEEVLTDLRSQIIDAGVTIKTLALPEVRMPGTLLRQVFGNIIGNAIRYGGAQGTLIEVGGERRDNRTRYFVRDHGVGIPQNERKEIFSLFYRGSTGKQTHGTGVGLAIVQKIARLYCGRAWAEETPGGGTTIFFELEDRGPPSRQQGGRR